MKKPRYVPPTLEQEGLKKHIDKHTNLGFEMFEVSILRGVNIANLRRLFDNKAHRTLKRWIVVYADAHPEKKAQLLKTYNLSEDKTDGHQGK